MFKKFLGGHAPRPPKMLRPFWAFGMLPLATYFTATGDNLHATAASKLNDSPVIIQVSEFVYLFYIVLAHVQCKTNNNILLFYAFVQHANDSFFHCFAFVLCIMTSAVLYYMDHKPLFCLPIPPEPERFIHLLCSFLPCFFVSFSNKLLSKPKKESVFYCL